MLVTKPHSSTVDPLRSIAGAWTGQRNYLGTSAAGTCLLILLIAFWPSFEKVGAPFDEGMLLVYPELVQHGHLPYRDFETFYGPANLLVLAAGYSLFSPTVFTERAIGLLYRVVILLAFFGIARRWCTITAAGGMFVAGAFLVGTQLIAYAWLGGVACGLLALWVLAHDRAVWSHFLGGGLAGLALLFRVDLGLAVALSALPFLYSTSWKYRARYGTGLALALSPLAILTWLAGPAQVFNNLFLFPVIICNPGRRLPLSSAQDYLIHLFVAHVVACVVNLAAGVIAIRRRSSPQNSALLLAVALFALGLTPQTIQRLDLVHLLSVGFLSLGLVPVSLAVLMQGRRQRAPSRVLPLTGLIAVMVALAATAPEIVTVVRNAFVAGFNPTSGRAVFLEQEGRAFPFPSIDVARLAARVLDKLETLSKPGERLFVGPLDLRRTNCSDTYIYHLFPKLRPATYFLEMNPFSANRAGSRLAADVESADWLVLNRAWDSWHEPNRSVENGPDFPNQVVQTHFTRVTESGPYVLFRRNP